jgi:hypothetical protein
MRNDLLSKQCTCPCRTSQVAELGESPEIVPHEVRDGGLNVANWGALAEKILVLKILILLCQPNRYLP